eukprot:EG_transcript_4910
MRRRAEVMEDVVFGGAGSRSPSSPVRGRRSPAPPPSVSPPPRLPRPVEDGDPRAAPAGQSRLCAHCGGDHIKTYCPHIDCYACGGFGHISTVCPSNPLMRTYKEAMRERRRQIDQGVPEAELPLPQRPALNRFTALRRQARVLDHARRDAPPARQSRDADGDLPSTRSPRSPPPYRPPREQRQPREPRGSSRPKRRREEVISLYVGNLAAFVTREELWQLFEPYQPLDVRVRQEEDEMGRVAKCVAFVDFATEPEAQRAYDALVYKPFHGRALALRFDEEDRESELRRLSALADKFIAWEEEIKELDEKHKRGEAIDQSKVEELQASTEDLEQRQAAIDRRVRELTVEPPPRPAPPAPRWGAMAYRPPPDRPPPPAPGGEPNRPEDRNGRHGFRPPAARTDVIRPFEAAGQRAAPPPPVPPGPAATPPATDAVGDVVLDPEDLEDVRDALRPFVGAVVCAMQRTLLPPEVCPALEAALFARPAWARLGAEGAEGEARTVWRSPNPEGGLGRGFFCPPELEEFLEAFEGLFDPRATIGIAQRPSAALPFQPGDWLVVLLRGRCTVKMPNPDGRLNQTELNTGDAAWLPLQARLQQEVQFEGRGTFLHFAKPRPASDPAH